MNRKLILPAAFITAALTLTACQGNTPSSAPGETSALISPSPESDMVLDFGDRFINNTGNVISVNSKETVSVVPDIAQIVYSVRTEDTTAAACQQKNAESVSSVIARLKELGVEEKSIQTSDYYMIPSNPSLIWQAATMKAIRKPCKRPWIPPTKRLRSLPLPAGAA